jgi:hypothetical protein
MDCAAGALSPGQAVELRWTEQAGGDGAWYGAVVKAVHANGAVDFTYTASPDWNEFDEHVAAAQLGPARLRAPQHRRRSARPRKELKFSYRDLEQGVVIRRKDTKEFAEMLLAPPTESGPGFRPDTVRRLAGAELCREVLEQDGFRTPLVVQQVTDIRGMRMPPQLSVEEIAERVGPDVIMPVLDVGPQEELSMSLRAWVAYWRDPQRVQRLNVTSLEITGTDLAQSVRAPGVVRELDWIDTVWPQQLKQQTLARLSAAACAGTSKFGIVDVPTAEKASATATERVEEDAQAPQAKEWTSCVPTAGLDPCWVGKRARDGTATDETAPSKRPREEEKAAGGVTAEQPTAADAETPTKQLEQEGAGAAEEGDSVPDATSDGTAALLLYASKLDRCADPPSHSGAAPPGGGRVADWGFPSSSPSNISGRCWPDAR